MKEIFQDVTELSELAAKIADEMRKLLEDSEALLQSLLQSLWEFAATLDIEPKSYEHFTQFDCLGHYVAAKMIRQPHGIWKYRTGFL